MDSPAPLQRRTEGLYLVTDRGLCGQRGLEEVVSLAVKGGAAWVQLREKDLPTRPFVEEASRLKKILAPLGVPLIINDRLDVVLASKADGIHIGQEDMPYEIARRLLGPKAIIGLSVETWEDVEQAQSLDVDYLGISPVFATPTKTDTKGPWGLEGVSRIRAFSRHPLVAIGGISRANAAAVILAGSDCIAVVSAICAAPDPRRAAEDLCREISAAQEQQKRAGQHCNRP
ncbi:thiamine-phosphate pyrophosphorylase [Syntrophus gentianae]|uniref:Thiamine-phosphate synthase n=2 Tax=Syntrophus gentianae TaxID=43775 RepID=A0A1H7VS24_9BACT|nr:thiamine-phosphate pyrophosphorylase [Syntrophus gentianae]